jgi:hypothetical protein
MLLWLFAARRQLRASKSNTSHWITAWHCAYSLPVLVIAEYARPDALIERNSEGEMQRVQVLGISEGYTYARRWGARTCSNATCSSCHTVCRNICNTGWLRWKVGGCTNCNIVIIIIDNSAPSLQRSNNRKSGLSNGMRSCNLRISVSSR